MLAQIAAGRADQPRRHLPQFLSANAHEAAVLKHLQQFGLHGEIQDARFIQKQRAHVGLLHTSLLGRVCARKGVPFIAE